MKDTLIKRKSAIWMLAIVAVVTSILVFSTSVFSLDAAKRYIVFNGDKWNMADDDKPNWVTNQDSISFTVDLKEDYQKYLDSLEEEVPEVPEEPEEPEEPEVPEVPEEPEEPEQPEGNEEAGPSESEGVEGESTTESTTNSHESSTPEEETNPQPQPEPVEPDLTIPFKINVDFPKTKKVEPVITEINPGLDFQGEYRVEIPLPAESRDGNLEVKVDFHPNKWGIPKSANSSFSIGRDKTAPVLELSGVEDGSLNRESVQVQIKVEEKNFSTSDLSLTVKKNGEDYQVDPSWNRGHTGEISFRDNGEYNIKVTAKDKAGNISKEESLKFYILKNGPDLKVTNTDNQSVINHNGYYPASNIEIKVKNGLLISDAELKVTKDGEPYESVSDFTIDNWQVTWNHLFDKDGKYVIEATVTDLFGERTVSPFEFTIDSTKPVLAINGVEDGKNYKEAKNVAISVNDANFNKENTHVKVTKKDIDGNEHDVRVNVDAYGKASYNFTEDGKYIIKLSSTDKAGNEATSQTVAFTIDKTYPIFSFSEDFYNKYYDDSKEFTISLTDLTLDLSNTVLNVLKDREPYVLSLASITDTKAAVTHTFEEGTYEIMYESTDKVGHVTEMTDPLTFTVDKTKPMVDIDVEDTQFYNEEQVVTVSIKEKNMDFNSVAVRKNGEKYEIDSLTVEGDTASTKHLFKEDGVYEIEVFSKDLSGNQNSLKKTFTIDKDGPDISFNGVERNEHYNNEEIAVSILVEDYTLDLAKSVVTVKHDDETFTIDPSEWKKRDQMKWLKRGEMTLLVAEEGDYDVTVSSEDYFGVKAEKSIAFTIDRTQPVIELSGIEDGGFVQNGDVTVNVLEHNYSSNNVSVMVEKDGVEQAVEWENKGESTKLVLPFDEDGDYQVTVAAVDKAGNKADAKKLTFTVDTIKPVISITDIKRYNSENQTVTISVDEHNFANNKVDIEVIETDTVTNKSKKISIGDWKNTAETSNLSFEFKNEFDYTVTVAAQDAAGNDAEGKSIVFTIDHTNPALKIEGIEDTEHYKSKSATFSVTDTNIDLEKTTLSVERNGKAYDIGKLALTSKIKGERSVTFKEEGNYSVSLHSTDKAGRKTTHDTITFVIDSTKPVLNISGVENNSFNPENKKVTVSVNERYFATNKVDLVVTKDNRPFNMGRFITNEKQLSSLSYNFTQDGLYAIKLTAEDKAGNGPVSDNMTFTIDKTNPSIDISGVDNEAHYNEDRRVNVSIRDVNLDVNKITVTRNGSSYNAGGFSVNNEVASFSHNFSQEGDYHIVVNATDKAGNRFSKQIRFTIDKTKPVITPKFKGESRVIKDGEFINKVFTPVFALDEQEDTIVSVTLNGKSVGTTPPVASKEMEYNYTVIARDKAGNETTLSISFTLDVTMPKLTISGVVDGFFNDDIAPTVTYSDVNLDKSKTSVTLNGRPFENGMKLEYEQDYILKATVTDLAKNVTSRTIVFTIDKTSPVITFKEPISNEYLNTDFIPDLIIEDMNEYDIITQTLNGQAYNVGEPITSEGKHVLYFEVKDKAGNIQQLSVEFMIDKTPPTVVYEGVEENGVYYEPVSIKLRLDNPNDIIKAVTINGELFEGDVVEEDGFKVIKATLTDINNYEVVVDAYDEAGNDISTVIPFEIAEKAAIVQFYENKPLFAGSIAGILALAGAGTTLVVRRKRQVEDGPRVEE